MASAVIPRKYSGGNFYPLLPKAITFFCDVLFEPCNHASVETLLRRRLQVVDQLQQVTKSTFTVIQFSASSSVDILPPTEMEERWDGSAALGSQRTQPLPSRLCLSLRQGEVTKSPVKYYMRAGHIREGIAREEAWP